MCFWWQHWDWFEECEQHNYSSSQDDEGDLNDVDSEYARFSSRGYGGGGVHSSRRASSHPVSLHSVVSLFASFDIHCF
jgi:hypothetical protein